MKTEVAFAWVVVLAVTAVAWAGPVYESPEKARADADYALQGEYIGEIRNDDGVFKVGMQVVAQGKGLFRAVAYEGGLPGEGWDGDGEKKHECPPTNAVEGVVTFSGTDENQLNWSAIVKESQVHLYINGNQLTSLSKVERKSPTLGKAVPEGGVVLFGGKKEDLAHWREGAKVSEDGLLMQGVTSKQTFGDHTLHVEFRLPYQPQERGQARGNSGVYLLGRYEVQMLDSFGLEGLDNECGGIYKVGRPAVHMCYPPLAWQTYDVEVTAAKFDESGNKTANARLTVHHNGVKIHDNIEAPGPTTASPLNDEKGPGPVYLQDHGNPVRYRNIWVVPKK